MLKLRIENFDKLPDGGPLEYSVDRRGFDVGRDSHLDWTLPDKNRVVSGKHCEIRFYEDAYWLIDVSTNGTYINSTKKRVQSPYRLNEGDQLFIGEYIIAVNLSLPVEQYAAPARFEPIPVPQPPAARGASIWDTPGEAPPPLDARDLMPKPSAAEQAPDFLNQALYVPGVVAAALTPAPVPKGGSAWAVDPEPASEPALPQSASPPQAIATPAPTKPFVTPLESATKTNLGSDWLHRFTKGAGLAPDAFEKLEPGAFAELLGQLMRTTCTELMALLQSRAEAKALSRGGRTMIRATENNPLKFMPTPEEALQAMLVPRGKGYLDAHQTLESSFADLKQHHIALIAAMQSAANDLLGELSPQAAVKASSTKKSLLGNAKAKQWDELEKRWASKSEKRENGILDAFLDEFAMHYEKYNRRKS